jgi:hypothetical protein
MKSTSFSRRAPIFVTVLVTTLYAGASARAAALPDGVVCVLQKKYTVTKMTADKSQITHDGVQLSLKQAGVYSLPCKGFMVLNNKVKEGKVAKQNFFVSVGFTRMHGHVQVR